MNKFFNFISPLFCESNGKISLARFWITILLIFACYHFWFLNVDVPATLAQVILMLLAYVISSKAINQGKSSFDNWADIKWKSTREVEKYRVESSKAAKCDDI